MGVLVVLGFFLLVAFIVSRWLTHKERKGAINAKSNSTSKRSEQSDSLRD